MNDYSKLKQFIQNDRWISALDYLYGLEDEFPMDIATTLNIVYCNGILLVEKDIPERVYNEYRDKSINHFRRALLRFSDNPEFLFYAGWMACIGEWNFGVEQSFLEKMIDRAYEISPTTFVYSWALCQRGPDQKSVEYKSKLYDNKVLCNSILEQYGPFGEYFLDCFRKRCY